MWHTKLIFKKHLIIRVRQGDALSFFLFCIVEEVFNRCIFHLVDSKKMLHMASSKGISFPTHVLYVDDIFMFCRVDNKSLNSWKIILTTYGSFYSQHITHDKSNFYSSDNYYNFVIRVTSILNGNHHSYVPFSYLGVPVFVGAPKKKFLQLLDDQVKFKLTFLER